MREKEKQTTGFRIHAVVQVKMECPYCDTENIVKADEFDTEELWYEQPAIQECWYCHKHFAVVINDDC